MVASRTRCSASSDPDALAHRTRLLLVGVRKHHAELVTAQPREQVTVTQRPAAEARDRAQHVVADRMPEHVVDRLEPVEVEEQHRERPAVAARTRELAPQRVIERAAVGDAGELVAASQTAELLEFARTRQQRLDQRLGLGRGGGEQLPRAGREPVRIAQRPRLRQFRQRQDQIGRGSGLPIGGRALRLQADLRHVVTM